MASYSDAFAVGQRVIFRPTTDRGQWQWFEGKIIATEASRFRVRKFELYCEPLSPGESALNRPGETMSIVGDSDHIRPLPEEADVFMAHTKAMMAQPTFKDPLEHLYVRPPGERIEILAREEEDLNNIGKEVLQNMQRDVSTRRKWSSEKMIMNYDSRQLLDSVVPDYLDLETLRRKAPEDSNAMLQLADATNYGLLGVRKDESRAARLYMCAARGISEEGHDHPYDVDFCYPLGPPEALCAYALSHWRALMKNFGGDDGLGRDPDGFLRFLVTGGNGRLIDTLRPVVSFLGHAVRRDWICPLALQIGDSLRVMQLLDPLLPDSMSLRLGVELRQERENELPPQAMSQFGLDPMLATAPPREMLLDMARPSDEQLSMFRPKALEIFLRMPARAMNPSGLCRSDRHLEYREMPFPPYPVFVMHINPQSEFIFDTIKLPESVTYNPFCEEAFEFIFTHLAFSCHMGDKKGGSRQRPSVVTLTNRLGDKKLATFIENRIGKNCGTEIRVVDSYNFTVKQYGGGKRTLFDIVSEIESRLVEGMRQEMKMDWKDSDIRTPVEISFYDRKDTPVEELLSTAQSLKDEGNSFFVRERFVAARKCYTEAINIIRCSVNTNDRVHELLGVLLSNRSACLLKTANGMGSESAKDALKNVVLDCEIALNSNWPMARSVRTKIEKRKGEALRRIDRLSSNSDGIGLTWTRRQAEQPQPQQQGAQRARGGRRKGNKKKKQQRKKKKSSNSERSSVVMEEDADDYVSIVIGKDLVKLHDSIGEKDPCPCCFDRYFVELADTHAVVNECGHACCLPCLSVLWKKHLSTRNSRKPIPWTCPICRFPLTESLLSDASSTIIDKTVSLQDRLIHLPLSKDEKLSVAKKLLLARNFMVGDVTLAIDSMLTDGLQSQLRRSADLTSSEKQSIYEEARRPVNILFDELNELRTRIRTMRDCESEEYQEATGREKEVQTILIPAALKSAQEYIWDRLNSAGKMGIEDIETGEIEVDFHALHVREARDRFDEYVLSILEAVGSILLVVGRGNHSEGKISKLKFALQKHIDRHAKNRFLRHSDVDGNEGMIRVKWKYL